MADDHLVFKTRLLLARRSQNVTTGTYLRQQWRRHAIVAACFGVLFYISCSIESYYLAVAIAAVWAGRLVRDIQWYWMLSREWDSTKELLDWDKIERIANSGKA